MLKGPGWLAFIFYLVAECRLLLKPPSPALLPKDWACVLWCCRRPAGGGPQRIHRGAGRYRAPLARGAAAWRVRPCQPRRPGEVSREPPPPPPLLSIVAPPQSHMSNLLCLCCHRSVRPPAPPPTCPPPPTAPRPPPCWLPATTAPAASAGAWWRPDQAARVHELTRNQLTSYKAT